MNKLLTYLLPLLVLCGCADSDPADPTVGTQPDSHPADMYLSVRVGVARENASRSNPTGGEEGDGSEQGESNERTIHNMVVFVVDGDVNSPASTSVVLRKATSTILPVDGKDDQRQAVFSLGEGEYAYSSTHHAIVVANAGTTFGTGIRTLGELRDAIPAAAWSQTAGLASASDFVMANANAAQGQIFYHSEVTEGTADNPNYSLGPGRYIDIERLAARIDFLAEQGFNADGSVTYTGLGLRSTDVLRIDAVLPLNLMQSPSYAIKRVSTDLSLMDYCGDELMVNSRPTNYVVEPRTLLKAAVMPQSTLAEWYAATRAEAVIDSPDWTADLLASARATNAEKVGAVTYSARILAYTNENTQPSSLHTSDFTTGLLLRGVYTPHTFADAEGTVTADASFAEGTTFWRYTLWRGASQSGAPDDVALYFKSEATAQAYVAAHPEYVGQLDEFTHGLCYYTVWIRHALDAPAAHVDPMIMEFATVRNNIYRLYFRFSGPGDPTPEYNDPETVKVRIFVRRWNVRQQDTIII